jgi:hypothetical protein
MNFLSGRNWQAGDSTELVEVSSPYGNAALHPTTSLAAGEQHIRLRNACGRWYNSDMESVVRNVDGLSAAEEHAVEALVGHRVEKRGQMLILILDEPAPDQRGRWEALMARVAPFHGSQAELEREIDQTIEEVRAGRS